MSGPEGQVIGRYVKNAQGKLEWCDDVDKHYAQLRYNDKKRKYTVDKPPRLYEVAIATGLTSSQAMGFLFVFSGQVFKSASHKVPLGIAIRFLDWIKTQ